MKSIKYLLPITSLMVTFLLSGCASPPSHLIIAPEMMTPSVTQHVDR